MEGNAGYMTDTEPGSLAAMIDLTKGTTWSWSTICNLRFRSRNA